MIDTKETLMRLFMATEDMRFLRMGVSECVDHMIACGVTVQQWIPVSERLPEDKNERVLVLVGAPKHFQPIGNYPIDTDRCFGKHGKWVRYGDKVTHWMPLPEPPNLT